MEITWKIYNMERKLDNDLVIKVTYGCEIKSTNFSNRKVGQVELEGEATSSDFIPYEELTPEIVTGWVKNVLTTEGVNDIETDLTDSLQSKESELANKTTEQGLPWNK